MEIVLANRMPYRIYTNIRFLLVMAALECGLLVHILPSSLCFKSEPQACSLEAPTYGASLWLSEESCRDSLSMPCIKLTISDHFGSKSMNQSINFVSLGPTDSQTIQ